MLISNILHISNQWRQRKCDFIIHQNSITHVAVVDFEIRIRSAMVSKSMPWRMYAAHLPEIIGFKLLGCTYPFSLSVSFLSSSLFSYFFYIFFSFIISFHPFFSVSSSTRYLLLT